MKILRKIIEANAPVSAQAMAKMVSASIKSERDIAEMAKVLDGLKIANGQQAEMLASLVNQISGLQMKKAEKQVEEDNKVEYDEAFQ
jgi:hypothetical protein